MNSTRLKEETKEYHDAIERVMNSKLLFSNKYTIDHYEKFIYQSYVYLGNIIPQVQDDWPEYAPLLTSKYEALQEDLSISSIQATTKNLNIERTNKFYRLGLIYIVLGAMLGNKIILKKLGEYNEFQDYPFNYLSEHQNYLSEIWKSFQERINQLDLEEIDHVIQGAKDGYSLFGE